MYFDGCTTTAGAKGLYRELAFIHHPDVGGTEESMKAVNAEYHSLLESLDGEMVFGTDGKEHVYHYRRDVEQEVMDMVVSLLKLNMSGVEVEIIGTWVWVQGDTKPHKEELKEMGCRWHSRRVAWYWRRFTYRRRYSGMSFNEMRRAFGSRTFEEAESGAVMT